MDELTTLDKHDAVFNHRILIDLQNAQAASQTWMKFLASKYGLLEGDQVTPSGEIVRKQQEPTPIRREGA